MNLNQQQIKTIQISTSEKLPQQHKVEIIDIPTCRICLMEMVNQDIFNPCQCKGSNSYFHQQCLIQWLKKSKQYKDSFLTYYSICEICKGHIFLLTKTRFRCITKQEIKQELFEKHICCTMTTIIFLFFAFIILGVILYVSSLASTKAQIVVYAVGISVTVVIILLTLIIYFCTYGLKSDVEIQGVDKKRKKLVSFNNKVPNNNCKVTPQNSYLSQFNQINPNITIDHLVMQSNLQ